MIASHPTDSRPDIGIEFARARVELDGGPALVATVAGPLEAPKVILLHGGGQTRGAWEGGLRSLANAGYRAFAFDARGHGESDWPDDGLYALEHWADDIKKLINHPDLAEVGHKVALVGASRGGQSALLAAVAHPERVSCVVLVDVTPRTDEAGIELVRRFLVRSAAGFNNPDEAAAIVSEFTKRPLRTDNSGLMRIMRRDGDGRWFWPWDPRMALPAFVRPPSEQLLMEEAAAAVKVPVLLIRAGRSEIVRDVDVAHFRELLPTLHVAEIPNIGHMISGDSNDAFMAPVVEFLRREHPTKPSTRRNDIQAGDARE